MIKYKPCCDKICALFGCETQKSGGCYCLCRLKDHESDLIHILEGKSYLQGDYIVYVPTRKPSPLKGQEKEDILIKLEKVRKKIKEYEINNEE